MCNGWDGEFVYKQMLYKSMQATLRPEEERGWKAEPTMHNKPYVNPVPFPPILEPSEAGAERAEPGPQSSNQGEGGRREERWEESFCCYVHWESPVWRIYAQLWADMTSCM